MLLPLRAFLGFTFCFAGLQKLANPRFFDAADPASIQAQLAGAGRLSPIHALISPLSHVAVPLGVVIVLGELAVGVGTLLGFRARAAAAGGVALALMLWLTVSFHSSPYYTGADIVFVFAWTPLLLAGSGSVLSLDGADRAPGWPPSARAGHRSSCRSASSWSNRSAATSRPTRCRGTRRSARATSGGARSWSTSGAACWSGGPTAVDRPDPGPRRHRRRRRPR